MSHGPNVINLHIERLYRMYLDLLENESKPGHGDFAVFFERQLLPDPAFMAEMKEHFRAKGKEDESGRPNPHAVRAAKALGALRRAHSRRLKTGRDEAYLICLVDLKMEYELAARYRWEAPCEAHKLRLMAAKKACEIATRYLTPEHSAFFGFLTESQG